MPSILPRPPWHHVLALGYHSCHLVSGKDLQMASTPNSFLPIIPSSNSTPPTHPCTSPSFQELLRVSSYTSPTPMSPSIPFSMNLLAASHLILHLSP